MMLRSGVELCRIQHESGRSFASEHPCSTTTWEDEGLRSLVALDGGLVSTLDMCQYGMVSEYKDGVAPVRKTTEIATNNPEFADALSARCPGGHRHVRLVSGRPRAAATYPVGFRKAMIEGFQMSQRRKEAGG